MFYDRNIDSKINRIQERALRIAYQDNTSHFEKLLKNEKSVSIHQKNLQLLMIEIYKTRNQLNLPFMMESFEEKAKMHEQFIANKSNNHILWNRHGKVHEPKNMGKITNRN